MNHLVGEKVAIVTHRPQTTRNRITGILTADNYQIVFLDTPGLNQDEIPELTYGEGIQSHYQGQSLKLSKHFK
ncbi:MAG: 2'-deoxycytidine 5'-triphosphate deaminase [Desulfonatronovibrio sp.]